LEIYIIYVGSIIKFVHRINEKVHDASVKSVVFLYTSILTRWG